MQGLSRIDTCKNAVKYNTQHCKSEPSQHVQVGLTWVVWWETGIVNIGTGGVPSGATFYRYGTCMETANVDRK